MTSGLRLVRRLSSPMRNRGAATSSHYPQPGPWTNSGQDSSRSAAAGMAWTDDAPGDRVGVGQHRPTRSNLTMPTIEDIRTWQGQNAHGINGDKLGTIADIYLDRESGEPEWAAIKTGMFGTKVSFAPLAEATRSDDGVQLPYTKEQLKDAPSAEADGELSQDEESALYRHYGLENTEAH